MLWEKLWSNHDILQQNLVFISYFWVHICILGSTTLAPQNRKKGQALLLHCGLWGLGQKTVLWCESTEKCHRIQTGDLIKCTSEPQYFIKLICDKRMRFTLKSREWARERKVLLMYLKEVEEDRKNHPLCGTMCHVWSVGFFHLLCEHILGIEPKF